MKPEQEKVGSVRRKCRNCAAYSRAAMECGRCAANNKPVKSSHYCQQWKVRALAGQHCE